MTCSMPRLSWDVSEYEYGISHGVIYPPNGDGEAWNGLTGVQETTEPAENPMYVDGLRIRDRTREDSFSAALTAYSHPLSFLDIVSRYRVTSFGFSYRVEKQTQHEIHILYNVLANASEFEHAQNSPGEYSWGISTVPLKLPEGGFTAHLIVDATIAYPSAVQELEDVLYGSDIGPARLPTPEEILTIFEGHAILKVTDNGDGSFTVDGPDEAIVMLDATTFQITWPSAIYISADTYKISSL